MSDPFIGEIVMFGGNFAPRNWAKCDGQLLSIASNTALFSILGTTYGGDGQSSFGLPDLKGRSPMHPGSGAGLPARSLGQKGGGATHSLTVAELPPHRHPVMCNTNGPDTADASGSYPASAEVWSTSQNNNSLHPEVLGQVGSGSSFDIQSPFQCVTFIIAITGLFPSPN